MKKQRYSPLGIGLGSIIDGRYPIEKKIGAGSVSTSYLVLDKQKNDSRVVLKLLDPAIVKNSNIFQKLQTDIEHAKAVAHPGVLKTIAVVENSYGQFYCTQDYAVGRTVRQIVQNEHNVELAVVDLMHCLLQAAEALAAVHESGIVHGDITHSSIIVTKQGEVKISDLGLKSLIQPCLLELQRGNYVKSPPFLAPEQLQGVPPSASSDVYALGILGFELFVGYLPFEAENCQEILARIASEPLPEIGQRISNHWPWLVEYLERTTAKEPSARFQSATEMVQFLSPRLEEERVRRAAALEKQERSVLNQIRLKFAGTEEQANRSVLILALGGLLIALLLALSLMFIFGDQAVEPTKEASDKLQLPTQKVYHNKRSDLGQIDEFISTIERLGQQEQKTKRKLQSAP